MSRHDSYLKSMSDQDWPMPSELLARSADRDVSDEKLQFLAYHDALTGLLNRQGFRDGLQEAMEEFAVWGNEPTLLFIDLDRFKLINDTYGHSVGDELLRTVAHRLSAIIGSDTPLSRLGGDEFAAIVHCDGQDQIALQLANQIVARLSQIFEIEGKHLRIGASCGIAHASSFPEDMDALIRAADLAMYHAKRGESGEISVFKDSMLSEQERKRRLEADLRAAIERSEFELCFQPLVDLQTRKIVCFETLARWSHPELGAISPGVFIPIAEETGLIIDLGAWVLEQACREALNWPDDIRVAVNLSPVQFSCARLLQSITGALASSGLDAARLELEITESALLGAERHNMSILHEIRKLGVRISMDDFGTGYSSLAYLQTFEFDKVKIDRRFIQDMHTNLSNAAIVEAIIGLCVKLGIKTTAEGIETEDDCEAVRATGCVEGQGYLFARPLASADARSLLAAE